MTRERIPCPVCGREVAVNQAGRFHHHGPMDERCLSSGMTPEIAANFNLPPLTAAQLELFRRCWRVGDVKPVEEEFGVVYVPPTWHGHRMCNGAWDLDSELSTVICHAQAWLERLVNGSKV